MTFQSAAVTILAAASIWLPTYAGVQTVTYTYTHNSVAVPIFRDSVDNRAIELA